MPTNFPTSVDVLTNPTAGSLVTSPNHADQHTNANDAIEAMQTWALAYEIDYVQITAPVNPTATTEATANTVITGSAKTYSGTTIIMVEFFSPFCKADSTVGGRTMSFYLYDGASSIGQLGVVAGGSTSSEWVPVHLYRRLTPSAASHTYSIRCAVSAGTGAVQAGAGGAAAQMPVFIRITRAN